MATSQQTKAVKIIFSSHDRLSCTLYITHNPIFLSSLGLSAYFLDMKNMQNLLAACRSMEELERGRGGPIFPIISCVVDSSKGLCWYRVVDDVLYVLRFDRKDRDRTNTSGIFVELHTIVPQKDGTLVEGNTTKWTLDVESFSLFLDYLERTKNPSEVQQ